MAKVSTAVSVTRGGSDASRKGKPKVPEHNMGPGGVLATASHANSSCSSRRAARSAALSRSGSSGAAADGVALAKPVALGSGGATPAKGRPLGSGSLAGATCRSA